VLRLQGHSPDLLFDALLPKEARLLPGELAKLDELLSDPKLLDAFAEHWRKAGASQRGRPTMAMATYLRLMVLKHRTGFGYATLMKAVADSLHLRRFCRIPLTEPVPDESTVRKLTRRIGPELTDQLIRSVIERALAEKRFRPRALRVDSTVAAADIRYPTDSGLAADAVRVLARAGRKVVAAVPAVRARVRDRSRAVGRRLRALTRTLKRRSGEAKKDIQRLTEETAAQVKAVAGSRQAVGPGQAVPVPSRRRLPEGSGQGDRLAGREHRAGPPDRGADHHAFRRSEDPRPAGVAV
jgi:IS5 family transposase